MQENFLAIAKRLFVTAYEEGEGTPDPVTDVTPEPPKEDKKPTKVFTQDEIDSIVRERLAREDKKIKELLDQNAELQKTAKLTDEERANLKKRHDEIRGELLNTKEIAEKEIETLRREKERLEKEKNDILLAERNRYNTYRIENELLLAAKANDARVPDQLVKLLRDSAEVVEKVDESGKPTGEYQVMVEVRGFNDGQPYVVKREPNEAVALLREMPDSWGNQFNSKAVQGFDLMTDQTVIARNSNTGLVTDKGYEAYKQSREKNKDKLGIQDSRMGTVRRGNSQ
jgi:hypothetical protein